MKKLMMALAFVGLGTAAANAQCDEFATPTTSKYSVATNSFWSNWFIQIGVDANITSVYDSGNWDEDWHNGRTYGVDFAIGKWFTPGVGIRFKANWENGAFYHAFRNTDHVWESADPHKGGSGAIYFDTEFNLSNMFCGYNQSRVWNMIIYPRAGIIRNFGRSTYAAAVGGGLESAWRLSKRVGLYIDAAYVVTTDEYLPFPKPTTGFGNFNSIASIDFGVTVNLGKTGWSKAVSLDDYEKLSAEACSKLAVLRAQLKDEQNENARLRDLLAKQPKAEAPKTEKIVASTATSVFFDINSSKLNSKKDIINLEAVASAAKNTGAKLVVVGSADSKTGSSAYNQKLSEARANAVADELVNLGVDRANIEIQAIGGVNDVAPFNLNRRAVVTLK